MQFATITRVSNDLNRRISSITLKNSFAFTAMQISLNSYRRFWKRERLFFVLDKDYSLSYSLFLFTLWWRSIFHVMPTFAPLLRMRRQQYGRAAPRPCRRGWSAPHERLLRVALALAPRVARHIRADVAAAPHRRGWDRLPLRDYFLKYIVFVF